MGKKVQILMSTYNGERYLRTQLNSLLMQSYSELSILIRDDGSTDKTIQILKEYAEQEEKISFYEGKNMGACLGFFDLIDHADKNVDYYAFCDQDDLWLPEKLEVAVKHLQKNQKGNKIPLLYCSALIIVNQDLKPIAYTNTRLQDKKIGFGNALVENINTGCTSVINKRMLKLLQETSRGNRNYICMHDWWMYMLATCFGKVYFDRNSYIYYRQHINNAVGMDINILKKWKKKWESLQKKRGILQNQIIEFSKLYPIPHRKQQMIEDCIQIKASWKVRIKLLIQNKVYRIHFWDNMICKILIISGQL